MHGCLLQVKTNVELKLFLPVDMKQSINGLFVTRYLRSQAKQSLSYLGQNLNQGLNLAYKYYIHVIYDAVQLVKYFGASLGQSSSREGMAKSVISKINA